MSDTVKPHQEVDGSSIIIDPRGPWTKLWDLLQYPWIPFAWAVLCAVPVILMPALFFLAALVFSVLWIAVVTKPDVLPIHLPISAEKIDANDPKPGENNGFYNARGSFFIGRIRGTGAEVWATFKALTQHFLIFGTTGAGKTESIVSYIVNYLAVGSGVAFQDAKAAPKAMFQVATFCRIFGRDDDFRVTNYIKGNTTHTPDPAERSSNDAAVFAKGSPSSNTQLLVSLIPASQGENKIFSERAISLVSAEMPALTDLRELGKLQIDPSVVRNYMSFKMFVELYRNNHISKRSRDALRGYLQSLPGYDETKDIANQPEEVTRQFGFAQAYFTRALASLSDDYGHIYLVGQGEIDYQDAVLNGRILMTLLPSMEKSGEELANLGKIVLTATRNGMVVGLGTIFEGSADDVVLNLPTNSDIPYGVMNDENAYMLVEGQEMINAQARGLGFGVMTGTQDAPGMLLNIEKTTKQIMANSAFKQIMYLDDTDTTDLAVELSGEANVMVRNNWEIKGDLGGYYATTGASIERKNRINATAIKKQSLGQAFILYQGKAHEVQVFNHGIKETGSDPLRRYVSHWYSVRMAKVKLPSVDDMRLLRGHANLPEWQELELMLSDDARAMLKEMNTYFSSMIQINRIARNYADADDALLELTLEIHASRKMLEEDFEPPVGILADIRDQAPRHYSDTAALFGYLLKNHSTERTALLRMADEAGLDTILDRFDAFDRVDDAQSSASGSGGGGLVGRDDHTIREPAIDPLEAYLAEGESDPFTDFISEADIPASHLENTPPPLWDKIDEYERPTRVPQPKAPLSPFANAVERNLPQMPWIASAAEYRVVEKSLVQTDMYFGAPAEKAQEAISDALDAIADSTVYPTTKMPAEPLSVESVRALISPFISKT